jgi:16S rRNA (cytosine967-C5)-methyltransferase
MRRLSEAAPFDDPDAATRLSYPDWVVERLRRDLGEKAALDALEAMNQPPRPHVRDDGYVQDPASGWVAGLVDAEPGHLVADVCAAPGGKATALGHLVRDGLVVAADARAGRVALIADNARSTGTAGTVTPVIADGRTPPFRPGAFDRVLVDAPCSGLGVLHRRPDARWRVEPDAIASLAATARDLIGAAAALVKPGGVLVYSVCTVTSEETVDVGAWAVEHLTEFTALPPPGGPWHPHGRGALLLPQVAGTDGMFVLRLRRA